MNPATQSGEEILSYKHFLKGSFNIFKDAILYRSQLYKRCNDFYFHFNDAFGVILIAFLILLGRSFLKKCLYKTFAAKFHISEKAKEKCCQCGWKVVFKVLVLSVMYYSSFVTNNPFNYPSRLISEGDRFEKPMEWHSKLSLQLSIAYFCLEIIDNSTSSLNKFDFFLLLFHHVLALIMLISSYVYRYETANIFGFFLAEIGATLIDVLKIISQFQIVNGKPNKFMATIMSLSLCVVTFIWALNRLYWHPLLIYNAVISKVSTFNTTTSFRATFIKTREWELLILFQFNLVFILMAGFWCLMLLKLCYDRFYRGHVITKDIREEEDQIYLEKPKKV